jgi:hypothetical protein
MDHSCFGYKQNKSWQQSKLTKPWSSQHDFGMMAMAVFFQMLEIINNQENSKIQVYLNLQATTFLILGQKKLFCHLTQ